eukprot:CAMPEP_0175044906 /NCGR_PEP_ID=MMETSP0052_2-20121109/4091_1 /TAXON_ID=51329 ORGANISM="Polytomella parva, Strain SAG 63-3" /NCGR_SAMPLE_ID=MMETSP0052_2 /ASSEMBLY_ACC=CAM_ASM_000194 /LENGTH=543 /DNA_ID=CAMNT_0016308305 /DNA_START=30 /DNA_END=1658 /DNA_ORIENTATION=-
MAALLPSSKGMTLKAPICHKYDNFLLVKKANNGIIVRNGALRAVNVKTVEPVIGEPLNKETTMNSRVNSNNTPNLVSMTSKLHPSSTTASSPSNIDVSSPESPSSPILSSAPRGQTIIALGLTIHNAPVELREKLAVSESDWPRAINDLCSYPHIDEAAILSTCNRMELYIVGRSWHLSVLEVEHWLSRSSGLPIEQLRPYLFLLRDNDATHHLMRVAGGLDSLVLGEGQILSQVRQVFRLGQSTPGFGRQMSHLFKQAIAAGKRVRTETTIGSGHVSVSSAAVELAQTKLPRKSWAGVHVCIVGAGKMSSLLAKHLGAHGCRTLTLVNRSLPRAEALRDDNPDMEIKVRLSTDLHACIDESDVVFFASGSNEILIHGSDVAALPSPPRKEMGGVRRFVDISVPRNVAADVNDIPGAVLYNVDNLREVVAAHRGERLKAAAAAEEVVSEEHGIFETWKQSLAMVPTLKALRNKAETIRQMEVEKALARMQGASERGRLTRRQVKAVEDLSKAIVSKLLYGPVMSLRGDTSSSPSAASSSMDGA